MRQGQAIFDDLTGEAVECAPGKLPSGWYAVNILALLYHQEYEFHHNIALSNLDKDPDRWPGIILHAGDQLGLAWMILDRFELHQAADVVKAARGGLGPVGSSDVSDSP